MHRGKISSMNFIDPKFTESETLFTKRGFKNNIYEKVSLNNITDIKVTKRESKTLFTKQIF